MKDARGHGSDGRGGKSGGPTFDNLESYYKGHPGNGFGETASEHLAIRQDDKTAATTLAGDHPKSAPVETHPAMASVAPSANHPGLGERGGVVSGGPRNAQGYRTTGTAYEGPRYHKGAVDNAIASSNRSGRHIGGREASKIHALLKGRH